MLFYVQKSFVFVAAYDLVCLPIKPTAEKLVLFLGNAAQQLYIVLVLSWLVKKNKLLTPLFYSSILCVFKKGGLRTSDEVLLHQLFLVFQYLYAAVVLGPHPEFQSIAFVQCEPHSAVEDRSAMRSVNVAHTSSCQHRAALLHRLQQNQRWHRPELNFFCFALRSTKRSRARPAPGR